VKRFKLSSVERGNFLHNIGTATFLWLDPARCTGRNRCPLGAFEGRIRCCTPVASRSGKHDGDGVVQCSRYGYQEIQMGRLRISRWPAHDLEQASSIERSRREIARADELCQTRKNVSRRRSCHLVIELSLDEGYNLAWATDCKATRYQHFYLSAFPSISFPCYYRTVLCTRRI